jgi:uncharacterized protein (TIGR00661 family)
MTQAIAMKEMLHRRGHEVVSVLIGANQTRQIPEFFTEAFSVPVRKFDSPGFSLRAARRVSTFASLGHVVRNWSLYTASLDFIGSILREARPDLIINFLDPVLGYYNLFRRPPVPTMTVAHHFMFDHPRYPKPPGFRLKSWGMRQYVNLTGARASRLALSFYPGEDIPSKRLYVCPPILRRQLFDLKPDRDGSHFLVYLLNHGYAEDVVAWHRRHPEVPVHCFYDRPGAPDEETKAPGLTFHALHGEKFLRMMAGARGVVCTAGFESISEAAYLDKPLLMVPVQGHLEQWINSLDAEQAGLGVRDFSFNLDRLLQPMSAARRAEFKRWVDRAEDIAVNAAERTAFGEQVSSPGSVCGDVPAQAH